MEEEHWYGQIGISPYPRNQFDCKIEDNKATHNILIIKSTTL